MLTRCWRLPVQNNIYKKNYILTYEFDYFQTHMLEFLFNNNFW